MPSLRYVVRLAGAAATLAFATGSTVVLLAPGRGSAAVTAILSTVCHSPRLCTRITNRSASGSALEGIAQGGDGLIGRTRNTGALPAGGVLGIDDSTSSTDANAGVLGSSKSGTGVHGLTSFDSSANHFGQSGVRGDDTSSTANANSAVYGSSQHNIGVLGTSTDPLNGAGVIGLDTVSGVAPPVVPAGDSGLGMLGVGPSDSSIGVGALNSSTTFPAFYAMNNGTGPIMTGMTNGTNVLVLDHAGNLTISGTLTQHGAPMSSVRSSAGGSLSTYSSQQSVPTLEDVGEARVSAGRGAVRFDPAFASVMDASRPYLVFVTPQGDTPGLYVTDKTARGFNVREHGSSSNIAFDYRVVAHPLGAPEARLPAVPKAATNGAIVRGAARLTHRITALGIPVERLAR